VESTGTRTFTFFAPAGGGTNLTAFHHETKKRRSYNLGSGDYIVQPLATADNARALARCHAAATGAHSRHGQLLPLEVYLEEGLALVTAVRAGAEPSLCELCQQSTHAFVSFGTADSHPPALKASCNDFDLAWDLDAAYLLEKVAQAYKVRGLWRPRAGAAAETPLPSCHDRVPTRSCPRIALGRAPNMKTVVLLHLHRSSAVWRAATANGLRITNLHAAQDLGLVDEDAAPPDGADTWVQSAYLIKEPRTLAAKRAAPEAVKRPWLAELRGAAGAAAAAAGAAVGDGDLDWSMEVVAVRCLEKLVDVVDGALAPDLMAPWAGELPSVAEAQLALIRGVAVLRYMYDHATSEGAGGGGDGWASPPHFSREYLLDLLDQVQERSLPVANAGAHGCVAPGCSSHGGVATLYNRWMTTVADEWEAAAARPVDLEELARKRAARARVEREWDASCLGLEASLKRAGVAAPGPSGSRGRWRV
jgi:hypothetical protein